MQSEDERRAWIGALASRGAASPLHSPRQPARTRGASRCRVSIRVSYRVLKFRAGGQDNAQEHTPWAHEQALRQWFQANKCASGAIVWPTPVTGDRQLHNEDGAPQGGLGAEDGDAQEVLQAGPVLQVVSCQPSIPAQ